MKEILVIVGSARKNGNTDRLAEAFSRGAGEAGHGVTKVFLGGKVINGCIGCDVCRSGRSCVQKDDMTELYPLIRRCDMLVLASPLYYWTISARLKAVIERLYALSARDEHPPKGRYEKYPEKDSVLLMTAADDLFWTFEQAVSYYRFGIVNYLGWRDRGCVLAGGCGGVGEKRHIEDTGYLEQAYCLGKNVYRDRELTPGEGALQ